MVLTLYGSPVSTCVKRVAVVLKEKEIPFTFVQIDMRKGEHKTPEYLEKQPFGQVPYIDDDGFVLYESRAIGRYLAAKYPSKGPTLLPTDPTANALFEQAASVEQSNFDPSASGLVAEKVFKKLYHGLDADEAKVAELTKALGGKLDAYETILSKQKYVAGNEITLADLFHLSYATLVQGINPEVFSSRPHVSKWLEGLQARPSWVAVKDGVQ
ncbi:glutathione S-transferase [Athelia psychrophila]|uniref:glutathione transferase n=1 Tax=Athelia psychrophila TaxID=1759441 RepID=A0A166JCW1_9AGAM|nr:glutathione S-transferase [Fibularhizoctonia sp. CBS 109695]